MRITGQGNRGIQYALPYQRRARHAGLSVRGGDGGFPWANLPDGNALDAWDFLTDQARFNSVAVGPLSNTPGWTFTRASTGYAQNAAGVLLPFASGELRRTDKGVLIEGARTNKCTNYNAVIPALVTMTATAATFNSGVTNATASGGDAGTLWGVVDDSAAIAAAGLSAAVTNGRVFKIDNSAGSAAAYITFGGTTGNTNTHTFSAYMRGSGGIRYGDNGGFGATATVTADYVRYSHADATVGSGAAFAIEAGAGEVVYCILNQMEDASFVSSPIPIAGASATRAADVLTVPVSGIDYPISLFAEFEVPVLTSITDYAFSVENVSIGTNSASIYKHAADAPAWIVYAGSVNQGNSNAASAVAVGVPVKAALRAGTNDLRFASTGTLLAADVSATAPATPTHVRFGSSGGSNMYLRRCALWTRALSDSELQSVTT